MGTRATRRRSPRRRRSGLAIFKSFFGVSCAVISTAVISPMVLPVLTEFARDRYNAWKEIVPEFHAQFKPVSSSQPQGTYYKFDYTLTAENLDIWRVATDVDFVIEAPRGCFLGPADREASPAGMEPLMGITTSKPPAQALDTDEWKIARLDKRERVVLHYSISCAGPAAWKPLVCSHVVDCLAPTDNSKVAARQSTITGPLALSAAEDGDGSSWKQSDPGSRHGAGKDSHDSLQTHTGNAVNSWSVAAALPTRNNDAIGRSIPHKAGNPQLVAVRRSISSVLIPYGSTSGCLTDTS